MAFVKLQDGGIHEVNDSELLDLIESGAEEVADPSATMSAKDSSDIKKIMSTNEKTDDVTDYQNADQAERELEAYRNDQLMQITDPVQKSLAEQQFNLAMKQHTDSKAEMLKRDPNLPYKVAAQSDDPEVLINAYAKQQGISPGAAKAKFAAGPAELRAQLRDGNIFQTELAATKDLFTAPLRLVKGVGGTAYDIANKKDSDFLKNVSDPRGLSGSIANDPSILPSLAIPGAGEVRLASILGKGAIKGLAPEIARQGVDLASGESTGPEYGNLALSSLGGVAGEGIGALRAVNKTRAGQNILGAEGSNLNDLIGFSEDATKANIQNAKGSVLQNILVPTKTPHSFKLDRNATSFEIPEQMGADELVAKYNKELEVARNRGQVSYEDFNDYKNSIKQLEDRLSTINKADDYQVEKEYKAWVKDHPDAAMDVGRKNIKRSMDMLDAFGNLKSTASTPFMGGMAAKPSTQASRDLREAMKAGVMGPKSEEILDLRYGGKADPDFGRGMLSRIIGSSNESPMGYQLSDILLNTGERATRTAPQVQKRDKPATKLKDNSKQMQSISDLIKGKK